VIRIIREEDEPKPALMQSFGLTDVQAEAILNMRLRSLRKLEEMEIRSEEKDLREERKKIRALLGSEGEQWKSIAAEIKEIRTLFGMSRTVVLGKVASQLPPASTVTVCEPSLSSIIRSCGQMYMQAVLSCPLQPSHFSVRTKVGIWFLLLGCGVDHQRKHWGKLGL
jgi:DNA gyrase/topoisomerase IV subunit A